MKEAGDDGDGAGDDDDGAGSGDTSNDEVWSLMMKSIYNFIVLYCSLSCLFLVITTMVSDLPTACVGGGGDTQTGISHPLPFSCVDLIKQC